jgi:ABC-2 type transport system ATP-binding protein
VTARAIEVVDLTMSYGALRAVDGVSLEVGEGEFVGILGPNGAGKTTTLETIEGLRKPDSGTVTVLGLPVWPRNSALLPRIGVQLQASSFFERLTAREQIRTFAALYGVRASAADEWLERVGLEDKAGSRVEDLSGGQAQRLSIASALVHDPDVVFLDEPTAALDPEAAYIVREAIESLRRSGRTIVLATHNLDEADRLCDRVAFVRGGLLRVDSPAGLRESLGGHGVEVALVRPPDEAVLAAARSVQGVTAVEVGPGGPGGGGRLLVTTADPAAATPPLVRALVTAGADILEVRERVTTLEQVYFDVMGVRPDLDGAA